MRLISRYWLIVPLLLLVLIARDWVEDTPATGEIEKSLDMRSTKSDYYLEDFKTRKFSVDGELEYVITGNTLAHYPEDDRSEITEPRVLLNRENATWQIDSALGQLTRNPDVFTLQGDVIVYREGIDSEPVTLRTSDLAVHTGSNEVRTDKPIEIIAETWQLRSVGLHSTIDAGKLNLLSEVTGHYEIVKPD